MPFLLPEVSLVSEAWKPCKRQLAEDTSILSEVLVNGQSWYFPESQATNRQTKAGHTSFSIAASPHPLTCPFRPGSSTPGLFLDFPQNRLKPPANSHTSLESWPQGYYVCYHTRDCSFLNLGICPKRGGKKSLTWSIKAVEGENCFIFLDSLNWRDHLTNIPKW